MKVSIKKVGVILIIVQIIHLIVILFLESNLKYQTPFFIGLRNDINFVLTIYFCLNLVLLLLTALRRKWYNYIVILNLYICFIIENWSYYP